jgi:hypothetical protein
LSVMATEALREPTAVGVNVTLIQQLAPVATVLAQLVVWAKSPGAVPPMAMFEMLSKALPMFESVTLCAALVVPVFCWLNVRLPGDRLTSGAGGGLPPPPPPPPPPQAAQIPTTSNAVAKSQAA